jgi:hypothetical protein
LRSAAIFSDSIKRPFTAETQRRREDQKTNYAVTT